MDADLGGTHLSEALEWIYCNLIKRNSINSQQLFVLTDGQVSNTDEVHEIVEGHRHWCEVHSFGIGSGVCRDLVEGLAICTGGLF